MSNSGSFDNDYGYGLAWSEQPIRKTFWDAVQSVGTGEPVGPFKDNKQAMEWIRSAVGQEAISTVPAFDRVFGLSNQHGLTWEDE